jgi:site-specific recombinase XerC
MTLAMASPHRHPRTGVYKFRKRVPERLRAVLGRTEITVSLGTKDPQEARRLYPEVAARIEREWQLLEGLERAPVLRPVALTEKQAQALAGEAFRRVLARREDEPGSPTIRKLEAALARSAFELARRETLDLEDVERIERVAGHLVDALLEERGMTVTEDARLKACRAVARAVAEAKEILTRRAQGDWIEPESKRFPSAEVLDVLDWRTEFDRYAKEVQLAEKTRRSWRKRIGDLMEFAGTNDLRRLTPEHLEDWKNRLIDSGLHRNTIRDGYLAAAKALCRHLGRRLPVDPTAGIRIAKAKTKRNRDKGFTRDEALTILRATLKPPPRRMTEDQQAARRWVPWLCAYSGARVNEITQLRHEDVKQVRSEGGEPVWVLDIKPEAGTTKSGTARSVPIHPHLIEQGFLDFWRSCRRPTLFYDERRSRGGSETHPLYQKTAERLARWVRELGVDDKEVDPNHGWRHRFRTIARAAKLSDPMIDHIKGHSPATVGETYGDRWPIVLFDAISMLPRYDVTAD